jgi:hypothetical protein
MMFQDVGEPGPLKQTYLPCIWYGKTTPLTTMAALKEGSRWNLRAGGKLPLYEAVTKQIRDANASQAASGDKTG